MYENSIFSIVAIMMFLNENSHSAIIMILLTTKYFIEILKM